MRDGRGEVESAREFAKFCDCRCMMREVREGRSHREERARERQQGIIKWEMR